MEHLNMMHVRARVKRIIMRRPTYFVTSITNVTNDIRLIRNCNAIILCPWEQQWTTSLYYRFWVRFAFLLSFWWPIWW